MKQTSPAPCQPCFSMDRNNSTILVEGHTRNIFVTLFSYWARTFGQENYLTFAFVPLYDASATKVLIEQFFDKFERVPHKEHSCEIILNLFSFSEDKLYVRKCERTDRHHQAVSGHYSSPCNSCSGELKPKCCLYLCKSET